MVQKKAVPVSAVGSEHLPYKQRVGGSNPSLPTNKSLAHRVQDFFVCFLKKSKKNFGSSRNCCTFAPLLTKTWAVSAVGSEHLPYKQRVGGSNPSLPTNRKIPHIAVRDFCLYTFITSATLPGAHQEDTRQVRYGHKKRASELQRAATTSLPLLRSRPGGLGGS